MLIESFPPEILIHIFRHAVNSGSCIAERCYSKSPTARYPEVLSHVNSRWRHLVLNTPSLWTHIDLIPLDSQQTGFFASRVQKMVKQASSAPLDIHIVEQYRPKYQYNSSHAKLLSSIAKQMRTLSLEHGVSSSYQGDTLSVLDDCFGKCEPGILTKLSLLFKWISPIVIHPTDRDDSYRDGLRLGVSSKALDAALLPIKSLRLHGAYFPWTSVAYSGLVELYLTRDMNHTKALIVDTDLVHILTSSPNLRIFHFGLKLTSSSQGAISPAQLPLLESLCVPSIPYSEVNAITRLIAPGPQPLRFSLKIHSQPVRVQGTETPEFFMRANITKLHVIAPTRPRPQRRKTLGQTVDQILHALPRLRELFLQDIAWIPSDDEKASSELCECNAQYNDRRLNALYVRGGIIHLTPIRKIVQRHSVKMLVLWGSVQDGKNELSDSDAELALTEVCPFVRVRCKDSYQRTPGWDLNGTMAW